MLTSNILNDVLIEAGESHSLSKSILAGATDLDIHDEFEIVKDFSLVRPLDVEICRLNPSKIERLLGWSSSASFPSMVSKLVHCDPFWVLGSVLIPC